MAPVYMAFLRFMGDEADARNYSYSLEVGANGRKLIWEGTPRSIRDSHRKVRDSHDGLIIQRNMALFFSGGDRKELKLRVTGKIWKEQQNLETGVCIPNLCSWDLGFNLLFFSSFQCVWWMNEWFRFLVYVKIQVVIAILFLHLVYSRVNCLRHSLQNFWFYNVVPVSLYYPMSHRLSPNKLDMDWSLL